MPGNTSITVSLYAKGEGVEDVTDSTDIAAEWDDEKNVDADGEKKSRFIFGDEVHFIVYCDVDYETETSLGATEVTEEEGTKQFTETLSFPKEKTATTSKPIIGMVGEAKWQGIGPLPSFTFEKNVITLTQKSLGVLTITYQTKAHFHKLTGLVKPDDYDEENDPGYPVLVIASTTSEEAP